MFENERKLDKTGDILAVFNFFLATQRGETKNQKKKNRRLKKTKQKK